MTHIFTYKPRLYGSRTEKPPEFTVTREEGEHYICLPPRRPWKGMRRKVRARVKWNKKRRRDQRIMRYWLKLPTPTGYQGITGSTTFIIKGGVIELWEDAHIVLRSLSDGRIAELCSNCAAICDCCGRPGDSFAAYLCPCECHSHVKIWNDNDPLPEEYQPFDKHGNPKAHR